MGTDCVDRHTFCIKSAHPKISLSFLLGFSIFALNSSSLQQTSDAWYQVVHVMIMYIRYARYTLL